ncbi:hypothetical protein KIL84_007886 [Mauremys mutica]|uniref:Uncharacterized protein n=1 Tax=Mauremys mutica TaxID=74926 RepID=A0A9D3X3K2_9SAUR|nr:hypothetical protein KIL84_007886 [Mauremys mutica]
MSVFLTQIQVRDQPGHLLCLEFSYNLKNIKEKNVLVKVCLGKSYSYILHMPQLFSSLCRDGAGKVIQKDLLWSLTEKSPFTVACTVLQLDQRPSQLPLATLTSFLITLQRFMVSWDSYHCC